VVDAIYKDVKGAHLNNSANGPIYVLPCDQEINITFFFGGQPYPIHPLDTNMDGSQFGLVDDGGKPICIGAVCVTSTPFVTHADQPLQFQPVSFDASFGSGEAPVFDMVLGMAWRKCRWRLKPRFRQLTFLYSEKCLFIRKYG
jgi:hypothetical protein